MVRDLIPRTGIIVSRLVDGPAGKLDTRLHDGGDAEPLALLLHPHPLYQGSMGSRLVYDTAAAVASAGRRAVRFDFRGVGRSEGTYGEGLGEAADAIAVIEAFAEPGQQVDLVGYSFGGAVAIHVAAQRPERVRRLAVLATPPRLRDARLSPLADAARVQAPTLLVTSDEDPFFTQDEARSLAGAFRPHARHEVIAGGGHFLEPSRNAAVAAHVVRFLSA